METNIESPVSRSASSRPREGFFKKARINRLTHLRKVSKMYRGSILRPDAILDARSEGTGLAKSRVKECTLEGPFCEMVVAALTLSETVSIVIRLTVRERTSCHPSWECDREETQHLLSKQLHREVCHFRHVLKRTKFGRRSRYQLISHDAHSRHCELHRTDRSVQSVSSVIQRGKLRIASRQRGDRVDYRGWEGNRAAIVPF